MNKPTSYYFTETDLKKVLLEVVSEKQKFLMLTKKRKELVKEFINPYQDQLIGRFFTKAQISYMNQKKESNTEPRYLGKSDIEKLSIHYAKYPKSKIKQVQHFIIKSILNAGFRVQEICDFDSDNGIDPHNNRLRILGKGKKWRWVHVDSDFINEMIGFKTKHKCDSNPTAKDSYGRSYRPFFVNGKGLPFTARNVQKFMENLNKLKLRHSLHPHLLRHTYAVFRIINQPTLSIEELRQDMGHENIETTKIYFRLAGAERIKLHKERSDKSEAKEEKIKSSSDRFCIECGTVIPREAKFCSACGNRV